MMAVDPALVFDNRAALNGKAGLHALVVGVSDYRYLSDSLAIDSADAAAPHFGLRKLSSPALSACLMSRALRLWSPTLSVPVATIRLLLSPTPQEAVERFSMARGASRSNWLEFARAAARWRDDTASHEDNVAFFYFGGHGVQRQLGDQVLLLEDFGSGVGGYLNDGIDTQQLLRGMAPCDTHKRMARRQLFLFDACRLTPPDMLQNEIEHVREIWPIPKTFTDDRNCTVLHATAPGDLSYALRGRSSVFARAFLAAMNRQAFQEDTGIIQAGTSSWSVRATSLVTSIAELVKHDPNPLCNGQNVKAAGAQHDFILRKVRRPPGVQISLRLQPSVESSRTALTLINSTTESLVRHSAAPITPYPYVSRLQAGIYIAELKLNPVLGKPGGSLRCAIMVGPQSHQFIFDMAAAKPA